MIRKKGVFMKLVDSPIFGKDELIKVNFSSSGKRNLLALSTGEEGRVFVVSPQGEITVRYDPEEALKMRVKC